MNELQDFDYIRFQCEKDLHDVFGTVLDTFPNLTGAEVRGQAYLWDILQRIKYNFLNDIDIQTFLTPKYVNGKISSRYDRIKKQLPAICYNARFNGYKKIENIRSITNLMFLDIDNFPSTEEALRYKELITGKYDWIVACSLSVSRQGLHVLIVVDKITDNNDFNRKYDFISTEYFDRRLDKESKSLTRYAVVPYDYNIYINENPKVLAVDSIIRNRENGIRSAYIKEVDSLSISDKEKGISSGYIKEKGICSDYEEKTLSTPYTFFTNFSIKDIINDAGRRNRLRFSKETDESLFQDPDIPLYVHEGIDVIRINLFPYRNTGVIEGHRHRFIGALTVQMLFLNSESTNSVDPDIKNDVLKFLLHINKEICDPPLTYKQVLNYFNWNCSKFEAGEIDISKYYQKQRAFWSKRTTLKGNEKRKVTCRIKNEPQVQESKRKVREAIENIKYNGEKITQAIIADVSGLSLSTVKKYREYYNELLGKKKFKNPDELTTSSENTDDNRENLCNEPPYQRKQEAEQTTLENDPEEVKGSMIISETEETTYERGKPDQENRKEIISDEQLEMAFIRVYGTFIGRIDEGKKELLYERFVEKMETMPKDDLQIMVIPLDNINDVGIFWKQALLDYKFWEICKDLPDTIAR